MTARSLRLIRLSDEGVTPAWRGNPRGHLAMPAADQPNEAVGATVVGRICRGAPQLIRGCEPDPQRAERLNRPMREDDATTKPRRHR
jgi:hypothetical protein